MKRRWVWATFPLWCLLALSPSWAQDAKDSGEDATADAAASEAAEESILSATELTGATVRDLRTIEESVHHLKERAFRSKATLQLLKELVVEGGTLGSRVALWHINRMSGAYAMESLQYFLDGRSVFSQSDSNGLSGPRELKIREQTAAPGSHGVQVQMSLRGNGFGIFSYLQTYQFKVQSGYSFDVEDGRLTTVRVVASSRGGPGKSFVDRLTVKYEERSERLRE